MPMPLPPPVTSAARPCIRSAKTGSFSLCSTVQHQLIVSSLPFLYVDVKVKVGSNGRSGWELCLCRFEVDVSARSIGLAVLALVGVAACSSDANDDDAVGPPAPATGDSAAVFGAPNEATGTPITIGVVTDGLSNNPDSAPLQATVNATVDYANDYLGGINGHVIEVEDCLTEGTPTGATLCGAQMVRDGVAAVLVPVSIQDSPSSRVWLSRGFRMSPTPRLTRPSSSARWVRPDEPHLSDRRAGSRGPGRGARQGRAHRHRRSRCDRSHHPDCGADFDNMGIGLQIVPISPQWLT